VYVLANQLKNSRSSEAFHHRSAKRRRHCRLVMTTGLRLGVNSRSHKYSGIAASSAFVALALRSSIGIVVRHSLPVLGLAVRALAFILLRQVVELVRGLSV